MYSPEIVVTTKDGMIVHLNRGQIYCSDCGRDITYDQMLEWFLSGSLQAHGFRGYANKKKRQNSNSIGRNAVNIALLAAAT